MKPKTMILMVVAIGCGLAASYMTSRLLADGDRRPTEATVKVLVAKQEGAAVRADQEPEDYFDREGSARRDVPREVPEEL